MENSFKRLYDTMLKALDNMVSGYELNQEKHMAIFKVAGDPFDIMLTVRVEEEFEQFVVLSQLEFIVPDKYKPEYLMIVSSINFEEMFLGGFDFSLTEGVTVFRYSQICEESLMSQEAMEIAIKYVYDTVNKYNERLFRASRGEFMYDEFEDDFEEESGDLKDIEEIGKKKELKSPKETDEKVRGSEIV